MAEQDGEAGRVKSLDDRFGALEHEQSEQRGMLSQILGKLGGGGDAPKGEPVTRGDDPLAGPDPGSMAEQMRQAVRDVRAEEAQAEKDRQHSADHDRLRTPDPEKAPREVMIRGKAKLQKIMFGGS